MTLTIEGGCHCGNIRFTLDWPGDEPLIGKRECGCSFCQKHGAAWTSHPDASLAFEVEKPERVSRYQFGTATADFYVCCVCGVAPLATSDIDDRLYAIVNVHSFEADPRLSFSHTATDFEGEDVKSRLARRRLNWIPSVR